MLKSAISLPIGKKMENAQKRVFFFRPIFFQIKISARDVAETFQIFITRSEVSSRPPKIFFISIEALKNILSQKVFFFWGGGFPLPAPPPKKKKKWNSRLTGKHFLREPIEAV